MTLATAATAAIVVLWLAALVLWQRLGRLRPDPRRPVPDLSAVRRGRRVIGWSLVVVTSLVYLRTMLEYAFALPQYTSPAAAWLFIVGWNLIVSAWVESGVLLRFFERSDRRRDASGPTGDGVASDARR